MTCLKIAEESQELKEELPYILLHSSQPCEENQYVLLFWMRLIYDDL